MADYKAIKGFNIQTVSSDPSNLQLGEMWYNSTTGKLKVTKLGVASWATGGSYPTPTSTCGSCGSQTAALSTCGGGGGAYNITAEYNGTSWTGTNVANVKRYQLNNMAGIQTAAMVCGGRDGSVGPVPFRRSSEEYGGSTWSTGNDMLADRSALSGVGTQTAAITFAGYQSPPNTELYDGTTFTAGVDMNAPRGNCGSVGTQTVALNYGGEPGPKTENESWNGTSWTIETGLPVGKVGPNSWGTTTQAICSRGGTPSVSTPTESWDGTAWSEETACPTAKSDSGNSTAPAGTYAAAVVWGGFPGSSTECFEWTVNAPSAGDVTTS